MKIKEQTRKLVAGCSKHCFEVVDAQSSVLRLWIELTKSVTISDRTDEVSNHTHDKPTLTWFEEIFEEYHSPFHN
ncbi:hypothetical protein [Streptococcus pneumoniae]|uniref:hypothetical protein n=1 Tax=Streptococcus pneumoniae TaxID=1313 RepID=UPI000990D9C9|nr:hypothetical protein [Streptococcus pneumoniae]